jgi:hypothetical protein
MRDSRAASIKGWETRKRREKALAACPELYGPDGSKRGTERHKVKSISEIFHRLQGRAAVACLVHTQEVAGSNPAPATNHGSGTPFSHVSGECRTNDAGIHGAPQRAMGVRHAVLTA